MGRHNIAAALLSAPAFLAGVAACGGADSARISGHFIGAAGEPVYLEKVVPGQSAAQVDTVVTNDKGEFGFKVELPDGQPNLFNLRYDGDMVPLLVSPREKVGVMSLGDLDGYRVSGSPESELVWRLHGILSGGAARLDSIATLFSLAGDEQRTLQRRNYSEEYMRIKRQHIGFIVENASSLAAVYALHQRLPGEDVLFNGENDYVYYQMVADSVRRRYPDSRYVQALDREVAELTAQRDLVNRLSDAEVSEVGYPDIDLPDMYGKRVKLSSLAGKVTVLDFWVSTDAGAALRNAEMKELWEAYSDEGLGVYQVSLDTSKPLWVNAVQEQRLPWTTVCDFRGTATGAAMLYNIDRIPSNFIIDRDGNIVGRDLYGDALESKIKELL